MRMRKDGGAEARARTRAGGRGGARTSRPECTLVLLEGLRIS